MPEARIKPTDYFDPMKWSGVYDLSIQSNRNFVFRRGIELVQDICSKIFQPNELWLDVGCGPGHLAAKLSDKGFSVIGVDHDIRMTEFASKRFLNGQKCDTLKFMTASAYSLPFMDNTIDGILATSLMGCLSSHNNFFREAYRVLRKNGFAIITFTSRNSLLLKINRCIRNIGFRFRESTDNNCIIRCYSRAEVLDDLQKVGFLLIDVIYYNFLLNLGNLIIPPKCLTIYCERINKYNFIRMLGRNFIIVIQKST